PAVAPTCRAERGGRLDGSPTGCLGAPVRRCRRVPEGVAMNTSTVVSPQQWEAAREQLLVKEKELTRARDALAAQRRRMPWTRVQHRYAFDGPDGRVKLLDLFDGRRQLIVYRAFMDPGVEGWPEHGCSGCSLMADHVGDLSHLHARDTTLVYVSRGPQEDITRIQKRMG